ncbi:PLP-dependent cysteine synthase family protein [Ningiella sp. W23]|uniref:PLP-dependent cysteine synthase family protein n=1 Tax=Ningiella sp. W23 TaxID=3023715 RepID=UPI00375734A2
MLKHSNTVSESKKDGFASDFSSTRDDTQSVNNEPELAHKIKQRFSHLEKLIGNTPMLAVHLRYKGELRVVYAKAEYYNLTGSIKDRMALNILREAYVSHALKPADTIVEATSGNAGIAMAALGKALGHRVKIFMPDWMSVERQNLLRSFGADLHLVSRQGGGFLGAIDQANDYATQYQNVFLTHQFSNQNNAMAHRIGTGPEIIQQLLQINKTPDAFVAGVGTGGTIMGVSFAFSQLCPEAKCFPMQPAESPTLSTGYKVGSHRIQGVSDDFIPDIVNLSTLDEIISVNDGDGIIMSQMLARELGLGVGISSGANLLAALKVQESLDGNSTVATIFCDDNKKYLSTDLTQQEPIKSGYLTPDIELLGYEALN